MRITYFNNIKKKLDFLAFQIETSSHINLLDINNHAEDFCAGLFNIIFSYNLVNANTVNKCSSTEAIDLIDDNAMICVQVSSTITKSKIENSLNKDFIKNNNSYNFKFISLYKKKPKFLTSLKNPYGIIFDQDKDIYDLSNILLEIKSLDILRLESVNRYINENIKLFEMSNYKIYTALADIIKILYENLSINTFPTKHLNDFEIENKIEFNNLNDLSAVFLDAKMFYSTINGIYDTYVNDGNYINLNIFSKLNEIYVILKKDYMGVELYYKIKEEFRKIIISSKNYDEKNEMALELLIDIILVDAFIKCRIYDNPKVIKK